MTEFKEDINVFGDITSQSTIIVDDGTASDELIIGFFPGVSDAYGIGPSSAVGNFKLVPNASIPLIKIGNEGTSTLAFIDAENNAVLNLNVIENGQVIIGSGGLDITSGGNITLGAGNTIDNVDIDNPDGSITVVSNRYQLANDQLAPGNNQYYGTNEIGNKQWLPSNVFGTEYQFATNNTEASTGSTTFQNYLTLTTPVIPAGTYRIGWFAVTRKSAASNDYSARVQIDDSIDLIDPANGGQIQVEHKDPGTNQRVPYSGFGEVTFATAGSHTIDYDYREQSGGTSFTYQVNLEIWRVS
jgi:hypothetical protein